MKDDLKSGETFNKQDWGHCWEAKAGGMAIIGWLIWMMASQLDMKKECLASDSFRPKGTSPY